MIAKILIALVALLSFAAGLAKAMHAPQEVEFFNQLEIAAFWLYPLGAIQIAGALATISQSARRLGLILIATGFAISSLMIFATGDTAFGAISLIPVAVSIWLSRRNTE